MSGTVIIGAGSCIIQAILQAFRFIPGVSDRAELHLSQIVGAGRERIPVDVLQRCDILIEEAAPWKGSGSISAEERAGLPASCATVTVPTLHFNSLWPLMAEDPRNRPEPGAPYGRFPFGMSDRLALRVMQTLPDLASRRAAYDATDLTTVVNLARTHELEVRNCFAREQGCDVRAAAYVMSHFREKRLYYTHNHPTGELMYFVLAQLFAVPVIRDFFKLPYDQLVVLARTWADTSNVFRGEEAPVHPSVAAHFGLKWWHKEHRYHWLGKSHTFDEWINFYLSYVPKDMPVPTAPPVPLPTTMGAVAAPKVEPAAHPTGFPREIPVGRYLAAMRERVEILPRLILRTGHRVDRTPPFVTSAIDPTLAQHGQLMASDQLRSYHAGDEFVASLPGATLLGNDGLVMHQGKLLADTFRNFRFGDSSDLVQSAEPSKLVLKPDVELRQRTLAGPHFVGAGGLSHDIGHWMFCTVPRLVAFLRQRETVPSLRLILPALPDSSVQTDTLARLGIDRTSVVEIGANEALTCDELFVTTPFDLWSVSPFCAAAARQVAEGPGPQVTPVESDRIFLTTAHGRRVIIDYDAMVATMAQHGFRVVQLDEMSLADRIATMKAARFIVGAHGSALTSLFFAQPGASVLELFSPWNPQPMYWSVASVCGLQYGYLVGQPGGAAEANWRYQIAPQRLGWALDAMLHGTGMLALG